MIALFLVVLTLSATTMVVFGSQSLFADSQTSSEAQHKAQKYLELALAQGRDDYDSVTVDATPIDDPDDNFYDKQVYLDSDGIAQCSKRVVSKISWTGEHGRTLSTILTSTIANLREMAALNGNCDTNPPVLGGWNPPETWNCEDFHPGGPKATGLDVLDRIVYMTSDNSPYFYIANTTNIPKGPENCQSQNGVLFVDTNGFDAGVKLNDVRVARIQGKVYAFVARHVTTDQLGIIDVTNINFPDEALNPISSTSAVPLFD